MTIEIHLSGDAVDILEGAASDLLRDVGGVEPRKTSAPEGDTSASRDPALVIAAASLAVSAATLMISIPGAIESTLNLIDRKKRADRVKALLNAARDTKGGATLQVGSEPPIDLATTDVDTVMDYLSQAARIAKD